MQIALEPTNVKLVNRVTPWLMECVLRTVLKARLSIQLLLLLFASLATPTANRAPMAILIVLPVSKTISSSQMAAVFLDQATVQMEPTKIVLEAVSIATPFAPSVFH